MLLIHKAKCTVSWEKDPERKAYESQQPPAEQAQMRDSGVLSMGRSQWNQGLELCLGVVHVRRFRKHTIWEKISDLIRQSYYLGATNKHGITDSRKCCSMGKEALRPNKMWESRRRPRAQALPYRSSQSLWKSPCQREFPRALIPWWKLRL